jgi:hypothetical protein
MYLKTEDPFKGEIYEPPEIHWDEEDKYAIIAFLLLSIDKKADKDGMVRMDDLFGLNETAPEPKEDGEPNEKKKKQETRDTVVRECEKFLDIVSGSERYDIIQDEIDKFIEGKDGDNVQCTIGGSYGTFGYNNIFQAARKSFGVDQNRLDGGNYRLWNLVKLVASDADYQGNKRRLLKHLARKWDIDGSVLPALEDAAKTLSAISRERRELTESDKPFREAANRLAELETREKEVWKALYALGIREDRDTSAMAESLQRLGVTAESLEEDEEPGIGDKLADGICSGIEKVTDILCAPFEWMTDKLTGL